MPDDAPSAETLRRAALYWEQSEADLKSARNALRGGDSLQASLLSFQAAINGLSVPCRLHGNFQPPAGVAELSSLCAEMDPRFAPLVGACPALLRAAEQNPFAPGRNADEEAELGKESLKEARAVLKLVKGYLKENRGRYFAP